MIFRLGIPDERIFRVALRNFHFTFLIESIHIAQDGKFPHQDLPSLVVITKDDLTLGLAVLTVLNGRCGLIFLGVSLLEKCF